MFTSRSTRGDQNTMPMPNGPFATAMLCVVAATSSAPSSALVPLISWRASSRGGEDGGGASVRAARTCGGEIDRRSALLGGTCGLVSAASAPSVLLPRAAQATPGRIPNWTLDDNVLFPTLALNTAGLTAEDAERATGLAAAAGVRHVDFHPGRERDGVAAHVAKHGRGDLFLTTKIRKAPPGTAPAAAAALVEAQIAEDLAVLGLDRVDMLMLRDSPDPAVIQAQWKSLEEALAAGRTRSVGVVNFCQGALAALLETAKVKPAVNYYMLHVGMGADAHGLRTFGESRGIRTFAYGACGEPGPNEALLASPVLRRVGAAHGKTPEEVALRWVLQTGAAVSVRPTTHFGLGVSTCREGSECQDGIKARAGSFDFKLSAQEMSELSAMTSPDDNPTLFSSAGCPGAFVMPK